MDELDFEILETLNETQNITKAALALYMTQSALSKRISALEAQLGASCPPPAGPYPAPSTWESPAITPNFTLAAS